MADGRRQPTVKLSSLNDGRGRRVPLTSFLWNLELERRGGKGEREGEEKTVEKQLSALGRRHTVGLPSRQGFFDDLYEGDALSCRLIDLLSAAHEIQKCTHKLTRQVVEEHLLLSG